MCSFVTEKHLKTADPEFPFCSMPVLFAFILQQR